MGHMKNENNKFGPVEGKVHNKDIFDWRTLCNYTGNASILAFGDLVEYAEKNPSWNGKNITNFPAKYKLVAQMTHDNFSVIYRFLKSSR